jgi:type IV pilus assembly protein PilB
MGAALPLTPELMQRFQTLAKVPPWDARRVASQANQDAVLFVQQLVQDEWIDRERAGQALAEAIGFTYVPLAQTLFQSSAQEKLPANEAKRFQALPVYRFGKAVTVAMAYPTHRESVAGLERLLMAPVSPVFSFPDEIARAIRVNYEADDNLDELIAKFDIDTLIATDGEFDRAQIEAMTTSKQIVHLSETLLLLAVRDQASDIHVEPKKHSLLIRFRVDGMLRDRFTLPRELAMPLLARFKVMAKMDVVERRKPQDGRINLTLPVNSVDIRCSTLPSLHGEKVVMRIIGARFTQEMLTLDKLSISPDILAQLKKVLRNPNGMLLVSGPTGSGKTTTLYGALNYVNHPGVNVVTIEDPVEYENSTLNQVMVNVREGRTFDNVLRAVLRQDPDVILVGEIRDIETARIVAQAALTGHLVLTTIHTGSALQALTRLVEMGVERFIVAPSIIGVMGQRLVRRLCDFCKTPFTAEPEEMREFFHWQPGTAMPRLYRAAGCSRCGGSGYHGRLAIHEFLRVDTELRDFIIQGREHTELRAVARAHGYRDVRFDGFRKALLGLTTLDEVCRVTAELLD